jgi:hypothetical protein
MSRKALKAFAEGPLQDETYGSGIYRRTSSEDLQVSKLFRDYFNVTGMDARDEYGAERYHQIKAYDAAMWPETAGSIRWRIHRDSHNAMEFRRAFPIVYQEDLVSSSSIAFHLVPHELMRRYEMILYGTGLEQCGENMTIIPS